MEFRNKYNFLSNSYPVNITIDDITYPSVENAYQAMKCENPDDRYAFVGISPTEAKRFGQSVKMKQDFKRHRVKIMEKLLHEKFKVKRGNVAEREFKPVADGNIKGSTALFDNHYINIRYVIKTLSEHVYYESVLNMYVIYKMTVK